MQEDVRESFVSSSSADLNFVEETVCWQLARVNHCYWTAVRFGRRSQNATEKCTENHADDVFRDLQHEDLHGVQVLVGLPSVRVLLEWAWTLRVGNLSAD